jgi:hypothetical protein
METGHAKGMPERLTPKDPGRVHSVFVDPLKVRLPVTATVSLAHRVSESVLVPAVPFLVLALAASLAPAVDASKYCGTNASLASCTRS